MVMFEKLTHLKRSSVLANWYSRQQPIAYSNAEDLYMDLIILRDELFITQDKTDKMSDLINEFIEVLDEFIMNFDDNLMEKVVEVLNEWQRSGYLNEIISDTLQWELDTYKRITDLTLSEKVGGGVKAEPEDLSATTLGLIDGSGGPINLLSVPQDRSVTKQKLSLEIEENKFSMLVNKVAELSTNWAVTGTTTTEILGGVRLTTGSVQTFARIGSVADISIGDVLFVRVRMKVLNGDSLRNRVMLRNGVSGYIHFQNLYEEPKNNIEETYYFRFDVTETLSTPTLFIDTIYPSAEAGRITEVYEASVFRVNNFYGSEPNIELINSLSNGTNDLFNANGIVKTINDLSLQDKIPLVYSKPPIYYWGLEYLHSWYEKVIDKKNVKMVWGGDSTTLNTGLLEGYKVNQLAKKIMLQGGYDELKIESINNGHGENTTVDWLREWLNVDLAENSDLYIIRYGLNDGGSNYFNGTPESRAVAFETRMREGLTRIRELKNPYELPIIIAMPVTTNSVSTDRTTDKWHNIIRPILQNLCREFQCAFVDLALFQYDRTGGTYWSSNGDSVHPNRYATVQYMSLFSDILYPKLLQGDF